MPEGVMRAGKVIGPGQQSKSNPPAPSPDAPRGWTWDETKGHWRPSGTRGKKGKNPWDGESPAEPDAVPEPDQDVPVDRDPDPGWLREEPKQKKRQTARDVPQNVQDDIAGLAGLVATPILTLLQQADPYCGTILAQNFSPILDATLPIICRSERIVAYFSEDKSDWMLWGKLAFALAPVAKAIADHHIFHTVEVRRDENGQVQVYRRQPGGDQGSHVTPPTQGEYDPSAYAA